QTPRNEGRLTLNPLAHVDWLGTVILPALTSLTGYGFLGWGRPVNVNPGVLRGGWSGLAVVALAGPLTNVGLAFLLGAAHALLGDSHPFAAGLAIRAMFLSLYLALFNLLPVPPLDGSKLLLALRLPPAAYIHMARYGLLVLILAMSLGNLGEWLASGTRQGARLILALFV
ncbi:MAG: site-2 protease family protein, partial [Bryobacteraceae bacterium]|nr:site-2 protease family protein [Bryobacteraceae bacterium]